MPQLIVETGEKGEIGTLPDELQKFLDKRIAGVVRDERDKADKRVDEARKQSGGDPAEAERIKSVERENSELREAEATRKKKYDEAQKIREDRHAADLKERDDKLTATTEESEKRKGRILSLARNEVRAAALQHGAREQSLEELVLILGPRIALNEHLESFVTDAKDGSKAGLDAEGKPLTVEGFVKQYLADHPHHKAATPGRGGGGRGGASMQGGNGGHTEKSAAVEEIARNPSVSSVAQALKHAGKAS